MQVKINESVDTFRVLREGGFYYVDKSLMLKEFLEDNFKSSVLFARPRRFGKTNFFRDKVDNAFVRDFISALWAGEEKQAEAALSQILEATLSFLS